MEAWYTRAIEPEVRDLVHLLRNNGVNTESSCGHKLEVQCQYLTDGFLQMLDDLLFNAGFRDYVIDIKVLREAGHLQTTLLITLKEIRMDYTSVGLLIGLIAEGSGVITELSDLAKKIQRGESITQEDITLARGKIRDAVSKWDQAGSETPIDPE